MEERRTHQVAKDQLQTLLKTTHKQVLGNRQMPKPLGFLSWASEEDREALFPLPSLFPVHLFF